MAYTLEKKILSEFIQLYRDLPCLWNTSHTFYSNKLSRNRAIDTLLEKYKELDSLADRSRVKKKIENMRTTYKRERNKVIKSQIAGGDLYEPSLWYYHEMTFLDHLNEPEYSETATAVMSIENTNDDADDNDDDDEEEERSKSPPAKRPKPTSIYINENENDFNETMKTSPATKKNKKTSVYLAEDENDFPEEHAYSIKAEPTTDHLYLGTNSESDLFGRTIANQLNELRPKQRFIAEKLISDVIFFGRLDKLKTGTTLKLNNDCF